MEGNSDPIAAWQALVGLANTRLDFIKTVAPGSITSAAVSGAANEVAGDQTDQASRPRLLHRRASAAGDPGCRPAAWDLADDVRT